MTRKWGFDYSYGVTVPENHWPDMVKNGYII